MANDQDLYAAPSKEELDSLQSTPVAPAAPDLYAAPSKDEMDLINPTEEISKTKAAVKGAEQGLTAGFSDEMEAYLSAQALKRGIGGKPDERPLNDIYKSELDSIRGEYKEAEKQHPAVTMASEIGSGLLMPLPGSSLIKGGKAVATGAKTLGQVAKEGALMGGLYGGVASAGKSEDDTLAGKLKDAGTGAAVGTAFGGIAAPLTQLGEQAISKGAGATYNALRQVPVIGDVLLGAKMMSQHGDVPFVGMQRAEKEMMGQSKDILGGMKGARREIGGEIQSKYAANESIPEDVLGDINDFKEAVSKINVGPSEEGPVRRLLDTADHLLETPDTERSSMDLWKFKQDLAKVKHHVLPAEVNDEIRTLEQNIAPKMKDFYGTAPEDKQYSAISNIFKSMKIKPENVAENAPLPGMPITPGPTESASKLMSLVKDLQSSDAKLTGPANEKLANITENLNLIDPKIANEFKLGMQDIRDRSDYHRIFNLEKSMHGIVPGLLSLGVRGVPLAAGAAMAAPFKIAKTIAQKQVKMPESIASFTKAIYDKSPEELQVMADTAKEMGAPAIKLFRTLQSATTMNDRARNAALFAAMQDPTNRELLKQMNPDNKEK